MAVGDAVLLDVVSSQKVLREFDDDGVPIRVDGVIKGIEGEFARVLIDAEFAPGMYGVLIRAKREQLAVNEGVHRWDKRTARAHARKRRNGMESSGYWVDPGE